jgi:hypothetical protein
MTVTLHIGEALLVDRAIVVGVAILVFGFISIGGLYLLRRLLPPTQNEAQSFTMRPQNLKEEVRRSEDVAASSIIDTGRPRAPRSSTEARSARALPAAVAEASVAQAAEPARRAAPSAAPTQTSTAVSILKSGVVEGMAYTLYSDGSIEAQLPGGTLRFGSITELRSHIEENAA